MSRARMSQHVIEMLVVGSDMKARVSQDVVEVLQAYTAGVAPSGFFGAAMSGDWVELLMSDNGSLARVSQDVVELLVQDGVESSGGSSGTAGTVTYGFAT